ncbi:HIT family protein [Sphingomonas jaspsi]|uniref:HIT family protein n=1 Tax=Sphingomonas jaspsi TaxID=392409 RepID=UPI0004B8B338|nr:HIT family protein [Sphingomonas jaspsi]
MDQVNATIMKFGYPETRLRDYRHWLLMLRPTQVTAGSLVLAAKSDARAFGDLPAGAHAELGIITHDLEQMLRRAVAYQRINYLMLMMVDPHVHFHIFPRYEGERTVAGVSMADTAWPGPPDLKSGQALTQDQIISMVAALKEPSLWSPGN